MTCRHCGRDRQNRGRGLCWTCWGLPGVRERFPPISSAGRRGTGQTGDVIPTPTTALPRTPEKFAVLVQRAERNELLFHPNDATE